MVTLGILGIIICSVALILGISQKHWKMAILMVVCIIFDIVITLMNL